MALTRVCERFIETPKKLEDVAPNTPAFTRNVRGGKRQVGECVERGNKKGPGKEWVRVAAADYASAPHPPLVFTMH